MSENTLTKNRLFFLAEWSIFNLLGWAFGCVFSLVIYFFVAELIYYPVLENIVPLLENILPPLVFGVSIGICQWIILKRLNINIFAWAFLTGIGYAIVINFYSWIFIAIYELVAKYDLPSWTIIVGFAILIPIGGVFMSGLQSIVIGEHISKSYFWIEAHVIGLVLPAIVAPLALFFKSFLLNILYSFELLYFLADMRWYLFFVFLFTITALCISILTSRILLEQSNISSAQ